MKQCNRCGAENADSAGFCYLCFTVLPQTIPTAAQAPYHAPGEVSDVAHYEGPLVVTTSRTDRLRRYALLSLWVVVPVVIALVVLFGIKLANRVPAPVASGAAGEIDIMNDPVQREMTNAGPVYNVAGRGMAVPLASYSIAAKVMGVHIDRRFEQDESLFPIDLALIWGKVAQTDYDKYIEYHFDNLWIYNQWLEFQVDPEKQPASISDADILYHISNNHIFPANKNIYNAVANLKHNQKVLMQGYLVRATNANGATMLSSLSRQDEGAGACECFFVTKIQVGDHAYQ